MTMKKTALALTTALLLALTACGSSGGQEEASPTAKADPQEEVAAADTAENNDDDTTESSGEESQKRTAAPDFTLPDGDGKDVRLSDYRGRVVVLNFWASWCGPCKMEMPDFQGLHEIWSQTEDGPVLLAVNLSDGYQGETIETAKAFLEKEGYTFKVLFDETGSAASIYTDGSIPTTYIIDQEGNLEAYQIGTVTADSVQSVVDELLVRAEGGA